MIKRFWTRLLLSSPRANAAHLPNPDIQLVFFLVAVRYAHSKELQGEFQ
jgi:hypothetical protein